MITDDLIEEIRAQADLVQIVGEQVALRRTGRTYRGPCPLHGGEGPNFSVDPERGIFKCFVCGEGGDVFAYPMKLLGLDFLDAVRLVAEKTGISVPERSAEPEDDPYKDLREALVFAADWFQGQLWETKQGEAAQQYLIKQRALSEDSVRRFTLGFAPDSWRGLREAASVHEIDDAVLMRAGLIKESERATEPFDTFRGRLMFPIYDARGRAIGFGGRALGGDDAPKYINSPDSSLFHKGKIVYGLNWSRHAIRREELVLVVEGFMDFVSLSARGIENVAAPLGTALTEQQARLLARYAKKSLLLYDSDKAGLRATFKAADQLLDAGVHPSVVTLPAGEDPDSIVRRGGEGALAEYVDAALDVMDRKIQILERRGYLSTIEGKRRSVDALLSTVRATADEALRDIYLDRVTAVTGVQGSTLERELRRPRPGVGRRGAAGEVPGEPNRGSDVSPPSPPPKLGAERKLLLLLIRDPSLVPRVNEEVAVEDFATAAYRDIYRALRESTLEGEAEDELQWARELPAPLFERVRELAADPEELTNPGAVLEEVVARLRGRKIEQRMSDLMTEMLVAEPEAQVELASEIRKLRRQRTALGSVLPGRGFFRGER
ncbi:MAG: DNA primase [Gemmatimonadota bacterium]